MTQKLGRKEYVCARCQQTINKGERHEVIEDPRFGYGSGNTTGHYNKPNRYHNECFKIEEEEASERTVKRCVDEYKQGNEPFKWCR